MMPTAAPITTTRNSDGSHRRLDAQEKNAIVYHMIDLLRAQWKTTGEVSDTVLRHEAKYQDDLIDMLYPTARDFFIRELDEEKKRLCHLAEDMGEQRAQRLDPVNFAFRAKRCPALFERLVKANTEWLNFMALCRDQAIEPTPVGPSLQVALLQNVLESLVKDHGLRLRILDDFRTQIGDELPPQQGHLI